MGNKLQCRGYLLIHQHAGWPPTSAKLGAAAPLPTPTDADGVHCRGSRGSPPMGWRVALLCHLSRSISLYLKQFT
jgi:hypothetical protein